MKQVDTAALAEQVTRGALVIDVRGADEYAAGHVPGARLVPLPTFPRAAQELDRDASLFVVCRSGARSQVATELLTGLGFDATNVAGGTDAWVAEGRPVEQGATR